MSKVAALPPSVTGPLITFATLMGAAVGSAIVFWFWRNLSPPVAALILIFSVAVPCIAIEFRRNISRNVFDFTRPNFCLQRTLRKIAALWSIYAVLVFCYAILPVYRLELYVPFHWLLWNFLPTFLALSVPYIALVDAYLVEPDDSLHAWGKYIFASSGMPKAKDINYLLGWVVKGFFLPLMFCFLCGQITALQAYGTFSLPSSRYVDVLSHVFEFLYTTVFFIDVLVATAGYMLTMRVLGTEIRSTEPTVIGWLIAVICYPPFWSSIYDSYFVYNDHRTWGSWLADTPALYTIWAVCILLAVTVYAWATVCFGIRFSNLTHRGIVTSGPYRWTKHPAYVSKNISWWLVSVPFLPDDGSAWTALQFCLGLAGVNLIYFLRAKTEERHLSQDPVYREYAAYIRKHGIFRWLAWRPGRLAGDIPRGTPDVI